ncbi:MAG: metal-sensing transcriptional repressor [Pseudomonadota bacterium]
MLHTHRHHGHPAILKRLKRAEGHLRSVIAMLDGARPCEDVAQQLHAVERAIANAKRALIHEHIDNCLDGDADRDALKAISRYL